MNSPLLVGKKTVILKRRDLMSVSKMGKRGPKKGHGGRPRGSYSGPREETEDPILKVVRKFWREQKRQERQRKRR